MSEGLVLRRTDYLETSVILNVITRDGFCSLMVKGAKRRNSEKLALSEPLTLISFEIGRPSTFPTLTEGEVSDPYFDLKADLYRFIIASVISDFAFQVKDSLVDIPSLYDLILLSLEGVRKDADPELSLFKFELL